tara:strand:- start:21 stop:755 length:735 start_codon:yes stop_codon:yes gene_type:complete
MLIPNQPNITPLKTCAVLLAGGSGNRMGAEDKILSTLGKIPVLFHSLEALNSSSNIYSIIVVVPKDKILSYTKRINDGNFKKVQKICVGGNSRQASVRAGLRFVQSEGWVLIHDAARPFITHQMISDATQAVKETGAATAAIPMTDTLKLSEDGGLSVKLTIQREKIWAAQTPQIFSVDIIKQAHKKPPISDFSDDSSLIEALGTKVKIFSGSTNNIKITFPNDLKVASYILDSIKDSNNRTLS